MDVPEVEPESPMQVTVPQTPKKSSEVLVRSSPNPILSSPVSRPSPVTVQASPVRSNDVTPVVERRFPARGNRGVKPTHLKDYVT